MAIINRKKTGGKPKVKRKPSAYNKRFGKALKKGLTWKQAHKAAKSKTKVKGKKKTKNKTKTRAKSKTKVKRTMSKKRKTSLKLGKYLIIAMAGMQVLPTATSRLLKGRYTGVGGAVEGIGIDLETLPRNLTRVVKGGAIIIVGNKARGMMTTGEREILNTNTVKVEV